MAKKEDTRPGNVRLRLQVTQTHAQRWVNVGPFQTLSGAKRLAEDLLADQIVQAVRVEHRNKGTWRPAWSFLAGLSLLIGVSLPTLTPATAEAYCGLIVGPDGPRQMAECRHQEIQEQLDTIRRQQQDAEMRRQNDELMRRIQEEDRRRQEQNQLCIGRCPR